MAEQSEDEGFFQINQNPKQYSIEFQFKKITITATTKIDLSDYR